MSVPVRLALSFVPTLPGALHAVVIPDSGCPIALSVWMLTSALCPYNPAIKFVQTLSGVTNVVVGQDIC